LTGLANRRMADLWLAEAVHLAGSCKVSLACVMVDIDHFKVVNDTFGHGVGDQVLRAAAGCLTAGVRGGDHVARLGGDEFLLLLPDTDLPGAVTIAERLRASLASLPIPPLENPVTASFGVTQLWAGDGPESLRGRADQALLLAKRNGRNRVETL
jgi:diguanylate cyclase (GGDEF)-like protein